MSATDILIAISLFSIIILSGCNNISENSNFIDLGSSGMEKGVNYEIYLPRIQNKDIVVDDVYVDIVIRFTDFYKYDNVLLDVTYVNLHKQADETIRVDIPLSEYDKDNFEKGRSVHSIKFKILEYKEIDQECPVYISTPMENTNGLISLGLILQEPNDSNGTI